MALSRAEKKHRKKLKRREDVRNKSKKYQLHVLRSVVGEVRKHPERVVEISNEDSLRGKLLKRYLNRRTQSAKPSKAK